MTSTLEVIVLIGCLSVTVRRGRGFMNPNILRTSLVDGAQDGDCRCQLCVSRFAKEEEEGSGGESEALGRQTTRSIPV